MTRSRRWLRPLGLGALLLVAFGRTGHAHVPRVAAAELDVEAPEVSHAIYGTLVGDTTQVFVTRLGFDQPFALPFELLVPRRRSLAEHRPMFAVVGPGLPAPTPAELEWLPRPLPPGAGVFLDRNDVAERPVIFESFTRRAFWTSGPVALALHEGAYEVWVFSPHGTAGDFVLGFGVEEDFSDEGCGDLARNWSTYAY
jgi:hypothetical protein